MTEARKIIPTLSVEEEIILCCARVQMSPEIRERLKTLLAQNPNWKRIDDLATSHRLHPLLFKHFKAEGFFEKIPTEFAAPIQHHATFTIARNLAQVHELVKTLKILREAEIEAIPFKGPILALNHYGNLGLREFYDLDILLHPSDILKAAVALTDNGFIAQQRLDESYLNTQLGCDFHSADGKVRLELHWSFLQKWLCYEIDLESIWRRSVPSQLAGFPIRTLSLNDQILYLCAHGVKHHWERLFWITDIAEILRTEKIDWPALLKQSHVQSSFRLLALGLHLAKTLLEAPIPEDIWATLQQQLPVHRLSQQVGSWLFNGNNRVSSGDWNETRFYLVAKDRWSDRLSYANHLLKLTLAPSDRDRAFVRLPPVLGFLYRAIRPIRWTAERFAVRKQKLG